MLDQPISRVTNLAFNVALAANLPKWQEFRAVFGDVSDLDNLPSFLRVEFAPDLAHGAGIARRLWALRTVPVLTFKPETASGPLVDKGVHNGPFGTERWYFINGILTNAEVAEWNADALSAMFGRPISVWYNASEGVIGDLIESAIGKSFENITEAVDANVEAFIHAICDDSVDRMILISHSQGTLITSVLLKMLEEWLKPPQLIGGAGAQKLSNERHIAKRLAGTEPKAEQPERSRRAEAYARKHLKPAHVARLECYCFATCCTSLTPVALTGQPPRHTPWLESYGNEFDLVARFGLLAPPHGIGSARIQGDRYRRDKAWGHFLNVHYLARLHRELQQGGPVGLTPFPENLLKKPRLFEYLNGQAPQTVYP
jgi:hypothetical protein